MRQTSHRRSRRQVTETVTLRGVFGTLGVFGALLVALSAPLLVAGVVGVVVAAAVVDKTAGALRGRVPDARSRLKVHVPVTDLSDRS